MNETTADTRVESAGMAQVIYTVESDPDNAQQAIVTYWLTNGARIGSMPVPKADRPDTH